MIPTPIDSPHLVSTHWAILAPALTQKLKWILEYAKTLPTLGVILKGSKWITEYARCFMVANSWYVNFQNRFYGVGCFGFWLKWIFGNPKPTVKSKSQSVLGGSLFWPIYYSQSKKPHWVVVFSFYMPPLWIQICLKVWMFRQLAVCMGIFFQISENYNIY